MTLYEQVELEEGVLVQFVGTYILRWPFNVLGSPDVGFRESEVDVEQLATTLRAIVELLPEQVRCDGNRTIYVCQCCQEYAYSREDIPHVDGVCALDIAQAALAAVEGDA